MIRNGKDIANGSVIETQVCVIGSGPAGVTAAWHLQKAGLKVTLIEGSRPVADYLNGYDQSWPDKLLLYNGVADGLFATNESEFLILPDTGQISRAWERERVFGGTSAHWGGQSRPLDPITFVKRPGFPGWPIDRGDLDLYYSLAAALCKLTDNFTAEYWAKELHAEVPHLPGLDAEMYQFIGGNYLNFATRTFDGGITIGQSAADVILNASLLDIDHSGGVVRSLRVASMNDQSPPQKATEFTIRADAYVLACGAVGNAHQLLLSNAGNEHDQVGRNFMCHPLAMNQVVKIKKTYLTYAEQRLMDGKKLVGARPDKFVSSSGVHVEGRFSPDAEQQTQLGIGSCWFWAGGGQYYFEMSPNPDSRVTLDETRDPVFGQPQTNIFWQLTDRDKATYEQTTALFQTAVESRGGEVEFSTWETVRDQLVVNGHHIGTTRMSADPTQGVVDKNLKVHSLDNLYVAGSSVFASAGISNPTFTIISLSIRLADHLIDVIGRPPA